MKRLTILGSTGSIGVNCLNVVETHAGEFEVAYLAAHANVALLHQQAQRFRPRAVVVVQPPAERNWMERFKKIGVEFLTGAAALVEIAGATDVEVVVNAIVGAAGLPATRQALQKGRTVALANKETLVVAGELITATARKHGGVLIPIDSEHSAVWQCLVGESRQRIEKLVLTASGGPFRQRPKDDFAGITVAEALNHPNWTMGRKITIDSATLMNKGLEVIEAHWLFEVAVDRIHVVIHPQSIIHSMVEFVDGSIKAQLGVPDMRVPIQYALTYPDRLPNEFPRLNFQQWRQLDFHEPDLEKFMCLRLAYEALREGGTAPAVLNAANEEAVHAFLAETIRFDRIPHLIDSALQKHQNHRQADFDGVLAADRWARDFVKKQIGC
ncbi:MAG: 1-deoxy-D-xylulose-5-phosphate reductoisomerase [candidate division KSB1 bacterium]|nr:1-deoxy-D-xylulose-5-phosphate reductoisomerase [candidate division KSB1 bacterium]MDZ7367117.1 1-deoxy-D-xylulose-5-phosphate reductoisomerase [candidate division KSB1 bacterium]MDZ7405095.1 1-deoxy-D-xylulose-5-phosphate reductoisomerase [candidate division KSB1 bacterium]